MLGVRRWRELVADRKNGRTLFGRPKPTVPVEDDDDNDDDDWQAK